tara:strand:- start:7 stop:744 length:738 start_codon:yes stop_codon:yes gene_type:complete
MSKTYKILKVRDKNDSYYTPVDRLFDLPFRLLINGKSQLSGKTSVIMNLLLNPQFGYEKMFDGDDIYIITNNKLDNKLKMLMDKLDIPEGNHMEFDEDMLKILYEDIEEEFMDDVGEGSKPKNKLMIIDDVAYSGGLRNYSKRNIIDRLVCNGRHALISTIFTSQKYSQTSTCLRTNISGAILFGTNAKEVDLIADDMSYYEKKKDFIKMFRETTKIPRSFLVVNYSNPPEELYLNTEFEPIKWK